LYHIASYSSKSKGRKIKNSKSRSVLISARDFHT